MKTMTTRERLLASSMICGAAFAAIAATPASAQSQQEVQEVVVTGSRIVRQDYVANSPIVSVGQAAIENTGQVTVEKSLSQMPSTAASDPHSCRASSGWRSLLPSGKYAPQPAASG